jgi:hypothetical protein
MECYITGFIAGVAVQLGFTIAILLKNEFRDRRTRREREKTMEMLRSAIPTSATYSKIN